ncbi:hypothetical protein PQQ99_28135 [Paraburkholderia sediminicola]|uniref:hypothetical protein n=1 Tax=Paraburkholderia sediminicola TaxID=458836 RepID=UPI0038BCE4B1
MNERNSTLLEIEGAMAPLFAVVAKAKDGASLLMRDTTFRRTSSPFELASVLRAEEPLAVLGGKGPVSWCWGFPGWEKRKPVLYQCGFEGRVGISDAFLELAGFDRADVQKELTLLESLGHVAFVEVKL